MKRNQLVFFAIIGLAILIAGAGFAVQALGSLTDDEPETASGNTQDPAEDPLGPPLTLEVAVNPLLADWADEAARAYNASNPIVENRPVRVQITEQDSLDVWTTGAGVWSAQRHPDAWIPEAGYALAFANDFNLEFDIVQPSLAQTPMIWGGYESRTDVIVRSYDEFSSQTVQQAAAAELWSDLGGAPQWRFIKLAFSNPNRLESGLAALLTLLNDYAATRDPGDDAATDSDFREWLMPIIRAVTDFNNPNPATIMATTGTSQIEIALLPEAQWLTTVEELTRAEPVAMFYPTYGVHLDFPFAVWAGDNAQPGARAAAEDFAAYLLGDGPKNDLGQAGFRPTNGVDLLSYAPFSAAAAQIRTTLPEDDYSPPSRQAILSLLRWFENES
ncbi:MAG: substrate-binding domain-containing protein [Anaerolineales bacterium]